jgi:1-phosphatidylinositol-4-phosphate 5-kinase
MEASQFRVLKEVDRSMLDGGLFRVNYESGAVYEGDLLDGRWHGKGKISFPSGDTYDGEWSMGLRDGVGIYVYATDGTVYEGDWKGGLKHGHGRLRYRNGDEYEGCVIVLFLNC